ncbi:hypothetical protein [Cupriavidus taiwanensis]|uniref:Uncharacterized protein n=1 Tax=Cupriavidus taiwanensis TaxID=164546 RepID=A0A7Z7NQB2_9BURK|nr:hypothetical protein [Cupriavidus taiwanensis]SOZ19162.1 hypothetical protein CBM2597_U40009 [Cupriavidus taiwanensis]SPC26103.1 hypothetical protein CBM2594_U40008 [Cupriavidus taiwanensis]SPD37765.1 protein of unknown function [Cupriavidus taiwanensis]
MAVQLWVRENSAPALLRYVDVPRGLIQPVDDFRQLCLRARDRSCGKHVGDADADKDKIAPHLSVSTLAARLVLGLTLKTGFDGSLPTSSEEG